MKIREKPIKTRNGIHHFNKKRIIIISGQHHFNLGTSEIPPNEGDNPARMEESCTKQRQYMRERDGEGTGSEEDWAKPGPETRKTHQEKSSGRKLA